MYFGEELHWQQFIKLNNIRKLPLREQKEYYNKYLNSLSAQRMLAQIGAAAGGESAITTPTNISPGLRLSFDSITNANAIVGDSSNVSDWNTLFDLPTNGTPFTSVSVVGNDVYLYNSGTLTLKADLFNDNDFILEVNDVGGYVTDIANNCFLSCDNLATVFFANATTAGNISFSTCTNLTTIDLPSLTTAGDYCFESCPLTTVNLPSLTTAGDYCFTDCTSLTTVNLPSLTTAGDYCFGYNTALTTVNLPACTALGSTTGNDGVFGFISGNTISLTVPAALMTADSGNPDGDIVDLQLNNPAITITTV